jgi:hypothetical protein
MLGSPAAKTFVIAKLPLRVDQRRAGDGKNGQPNNDRLEHVFLHGSQDDGTKTPASPQLKLKFGQMNVPTDYGFVIFRADFHARQNGSNSVQWRCLRDPKAGRHGHEPTGRATRQSACGRVGDDSAALTRSPTRVTSIAAISTRGFPAKRSPPMP